MDTVSESASAKTWTCEITLKEGRLPDIAALDRHILEMRSGARLRGVEATVLGRLVADKDRLSFLIAGSEASLALSPIRRKVQWDVAAKREQAITKEEKRAFDQLRAQTLPPETLLELIGPLEASKEKDGKTYLTLQVRTFRRVTPPPDPTPCAR